VIAPVRSRYIGAVALALGVGAGLTLGGAGVAGADTTDAATAGPAHAESVAGNPARPAAPRPSVRPSVRRGATPHRPITSATRGKDTVAAAPYGPVVSPVSWMVAAAASRPRPRVAGLPAASVPTGRSVGAATPKAAAHTTDPFTSFFSGLAATFANQSPTLHPIQTGQGANGVVSGVLGAVDGDSAPLTYTVARNPVHGSVAVSADGTYTYTADPSTGAAGTTDSFVVTVSDAGSGFHVHGLVGLINALTFGLIGDSGHSGGAMVSVTVTPFTTPPTRPDGTLSTFCGCTLMPANTVFHADISNLPVLAKSDTWISLLGGTLRATWGGDPWMGNTSGMPVNTVAADRPTERVIFNRGLTTSGPTIDDRPYAIPDYPLVEGMPNVPAWDRHLLVFQEGNCTSQELYNVANGVELPANSIGDALANAIYANQYGSTWIAEAGVRYDMSDPLYPVIGEANASQLPYLPLILRPDDLDRGTIDHMLGITIAKDRGTGYTWPARSGDGTGTNPNRVPMGTVLRLRADFDITGYDPATQVILRALQQHGAVIYDSFGPGQGGAQLLAMSNGWNGTVYLAAQQQLRTVPMSAFEAVDMLSLAVDPAAGWMINA